MEMYRSHVMICGGTDCTSTYSEQIAQNFEDEIKKQGLDKEIIVERTGCFGLCALGPVVIIYPEAVFYSEVKPEDVEVLVKEHLLKGRVVTSLLYAETLEDNTVRSINELDFYKKQVRIVLRNCGIINPENIDEYIAFDGYKALEKVLHTLSPEAVIDIVKRSGLRGRGIGGFPTGMKWSFAATSQDKKKYVLCNADKGDPGAFIDRSLLEGDPHSVIEAMTIAAYAIGADQGYIYCRAEYPIAVKRLNIAIDQAREYGLLGQNIMDTGFNFDLKVRPAVKDLFAKPAILSNVETYANIAPIFLNGPEWFASMGTEKSKGTKVFALGGKISNAGLVELPMGTTMREIIFEIGGGIPDGKKFKAAQMGGSSGGCISEQHLDVPIDYDNLIALGSMMGSGGLTVMDEDNCIVDIARYFLDFIADESCRKCTPCCEGTKRMLEILDRIIAGKGQEEDIEKLENLAQTIQKSAHCGLEQSAVNPVLSTLRFFKEEYEAHIIDKKCPAGVCKALLNDTV